MKEEQPWQALALAAGMGNRLRNNGEYEGPKALFPLCGTSMLSLVLQSLGLAGFSDPLVVVGYKAEQVIATFPEISYVRQKVLSGTGTAVLVGIQHLKPGPILICNVDTPLVRPETYREIRRLLVSSGAAMVLGTVTARLSDWPAFREFGQVKTNAAGQITAVTEGGVSLEGDTSLHTFVSGVYACDWAWLMEALPSVQPIHTRNGSKEVPFTGVVKLAAMEGKLVKYSMSPEEAFGVNTLEQARYAEDLLLQRIQGEAIAIS